jgi:hypothetical protein
VASISFRLIRNVTLADTGSFFASVPVRHVARTTSEGYEVAKMEFDMSKVYEMPLDPELQYREPKVPAGATQRMVDALTDAAFARWIKARGDSERLKSTLLHHVNRKTLEIVDDPSGFLDSDFVTGAEADAAGAITETINASAGSSKKAPK